MRLEGERGNGAVKGRKLPGEVLQCFQNLSSHSAELSGMNNRFGTWPACTGEAVTAALRAGLPTFDGCAVSQNSWRRGALAACMRRRKKGKQTKSKSRDFFVRQTHTSGLCWSETGHLAARPAGPYTHHEKQLLPPHSPLSLPDEGHGEGAPHTVPPPRGCSPSGGAQQQVRASCSS